MRCTRPQCGTWRLASLSLLALTLLLATAGASGCLVSGLREPSSSPGDVTPHLNRLDRAYAALLGIQPKLAITMREYGTRFALEFFAAQGGNWALAAYEDHYMRAALNPTALTKPAEFRTLRSWETVNLDPLLTAIGAGNGRTFAAQAARVVQACNDCHKALGYPMLKYRLPQTPPEPYLDFTLPTKASEFKDLKLPTPSGSTEAGAASATAAAP